MVDKKSSDPHPAPENESRIPSEGREVTSPDCVVTATLSVDEIIRRIRSEIEPIVESATEKAARQEHERTREWLENRGLPKAARVAQHEAYNVLRRYGVISESACDSRSHAEVGRNDYTPPPPHPLSQNEVAELAEACVAMLETRGQSVNLTLSEMSAEAGGFLLPEDAPRVREMVNSLLSASADREVRGEFRSCQLALTSKD